MKKYANKMAHYAKENTLGFVSYLLCISFILFYIGFYFGRIMAR
jgi:hypothetical protein